MAAYNAELHKKYNGYLGTSSAVKTAAKYKYIVAAGDKRLLDGFTKSVDKGDISVLAGYNSYRDTARSIERELIGLTAVNGVEIKGYVM